MAVITAKSLDKKTVTLSDGTIIGKLSNALVNFKTGDILSLLVKPSKEISDFEMHDGVYVIPFECVKSISDYIVVDKKKTGIR